MCVDLRSVAEDKEQEALKGEQRSEILVQESKFRWGGGFIPFQLLTRDPDGSCRH
jgi:hypothetical protein